MRIAEIRPNVLFDTAFAAAREVGADIFTWRGMEYHTARSDDLPPVESDTIVRVYNRPKNGASK